jgi:hypothetical protein
VVQTVTGIPVAGAKVVLLRATASSGPFTPVPNGSEIMSPANRRDPDQTDSLGHFGWDVTGGFYSVTAQRSGCTSSSGGSIGKTGVYKVPPPVTTLLIKLDCPHLRRVASHIKVRAKTVQGTMTLVTATVTGRQPTGLVTFTAHGRHVTVVLNTRTRQAEFALSGTRGTVTIQYGGDGHNDPSHARG